MMTKTIDMMMMVKNNSLYGHNLSLTSIPYWSLTSSNHCRTCWW